MATDRQLYEKLGKLLDAADKKASEYDYDSRDHIYGKIHELFYKIEGEIKTPRGYYYDDDTTYEGPMRAIYESYEENLWLMDVIDEITDDEGGLQDEDT